MKECPECGSVETERVYAVWNIDTVEEVRACMACPTEHVIEYGNPHVINTVTHEN